MTCLCGDTECPSCGLAQGTLDDTVIPCHACKDGYVWTRDGQTGAPCPVCHGTAILPAREGE